MNDNNDNKIVLPAPPQDGETRVFCLGNKFKRKILVAFVVSKKVYNLLIQDRDFFVRVQDVVLLKLDALKRNNVLQNENDDCKKLFLTGSTSDGKTLKMKINFEKLDEFKLSKLRIPNPPIPMTPNNAFFVSITMLSENDYEEFNQTSWEIS
jgi:hypothetical protein